MRTLVRFLNLIAILTITGIIYWHQFENTSFMLKWNNFQAANGIYIMLIVSGILTLLEYLYHYAHDQTDAQA